MVSATPSRARPTSFIVRILRYDRDDWQGQLVDVRSGQIHPFTSFLQLQRLMLAMADQPAEAGAFDATPGWPQGVARMGQLRGPVMTGTDLDAERFARRGG